MGLSLQEFDPCSIPIKESEAQKAPVTVSLNSRLYLAEETKTAFQTAINTPNILETMPISESSGVKIGDQRAVVVEGIEEASDQGQDRIELSAIQGDLAEVHQKSLENDLEYARIFSRLTQ